MDKTIIGFTGKYYGDYDYKVDLTHMTLEIIWSPNNKVVSTYNIIDCEMFADDSMIEVEYKLGKALACDHFNIGSIIKKPFNKVFVDIDEALYEQGETHVAVDTEIYNRIPTNIRDKKELIKTLKVNMNKLVDQYEAIVEKSDKLDYDEVVKSGNLLDMITDLQYKIDNLKEE